MISYDFTINEQDYQFQIFADESFLVARRHGYSLDYGSSNTGHIKGGRFIWYPHTLAFHMTQEVKDMCERYLKLMVFS